MPDNNGHFLTEEKALDKVAQASIQGRAVPLEGYGSPVTLLFYMAQTADGIDKWWTPKRDSQLREAWKTEPIMAGAVYSMVAKLKTLEYALDGPPRQVSRFQPVLANAEFGKGWGNLMDKSCQDFLTVDRGVFWELIRPDNDDPRSPIIGVAHLDALRCTLTGDMEYPVVYSNPRTGQYHRLADHQVVHMVSMPSPDETMYDVGLCAVSRAFRALQITRDIITYKREKLSSRPKRGIVYANGITQSQLQDAIKQASEDQDNKGLQRFGELVVTASLDPSATVDIKMLEFASLPDGFDEESSLTLYVYVLALAMGVDAREFWPATASGATKADALVQAQKARGKGPGDMLKTFERAINWKILPDSLTFRFDFQDDEEDAQRAELRKRKADTINMMYLGGQGVEGIIDREEARQIAADEGLIPQEFLVVDQTEDITVDDIEQPKEPEEPEAPPEIVMDGETPEGTAEKDAEAKEDSGAQQEAIRGQIAALEVELVRSLEVDLRRAQEAELMRSAAKEAEEKALEKEREADRGRQERIETQLAQLRAMLEERQERAKTRGRVVVRKDVVRGDDGRIAQVIERYEEV